MHRTQRLPGILFDRDGTLIEDPGYLSSPNQVRWLPGVLDALRSLHQAGFVLATVSNQSGISRGYFGQEQLAAVEERIRNDVAAAGGHLSGQYTCPHLLEITGPCTCRKPGNGMLEQAIQDLHLDRARTWMVGDSARDCEAGERSGLRTFLVGKDDGVTDFFATLFDTTDRQS